MNQTITSECVTLSDHAYQTYTDMIQSAVKRKQHQALCRDEIELHKEEFEVCPQSRTLTIRIFSTKGKLLVEFTVPANEYKIKHPFNDCQDCGVFQSIQAMSEQLGSTPAPCLKGCYECRVRFEVLRQQMKKMKARYNRQVRS